MRTECDPCKRWDHTACEGDCLDCGGESGRSLSPEVRAIRRYLPTIYTDQMVVDFECGCWQGSREERFRYDCPLHAPARNQS